MARDTAYATEIATATFSYTGEDEDEVRIERIFVKQYSQVELRFSWWRKGRLLPRPMDLPPQDFLTLVERGIEAGVFTDGEIEGLANIIARHRG